MNTRVMSNMLEKQGNIFYTSTMRGNVMCTH